MPRLDSVRYFFIFLIIPSGFCCKTMTKWMDVLENFDPGKSEVENMKANGYRRIFDCGNMVFEKTY